MYTYIRIHTATQLFISFHFNQQNCSLAIQTHHEGGEGRDNFELQLQQEGITIGFIELLLSLYHFIQIFHGLIFASILIGFSELTKSFYASLNTY